MAGFRWIIKSSFLMLLFSFTEAASFTVRVGDEATLPCENVIKDQNKCDKTSWLFYNSSNTATLFEHGQIHKDAAAKSDRLRVTEQCSLVIKKVTEEDAGYYTCNQTRSGKTTHSSQAFLAVVTMTEHRKSDELELTCSVSIHQWCGHSVKLLYKGKDVDEDEKDEKDIKTSTSECSGTVTFPASYLEQKTKYYDLFSCKVKDIDMQTVHLFHFSPPQSSGDDAQKKPTKKTTTTTAATSPTTTKSTSTAAEKSVTMSTNEEENKAASETNHDRTNRGGLLWWQRLICVFVSVAALLIISVSVLRCRRTKGNKTQTDENMADPEDGVSYASITYTKKTNRKAQDPAAAAAADDDDDEDEDDTVTYSTVKAPLPSTADPSNLDASVNKPNK